MDTSTIPDNEWVRRWMTVTHLKDSLYFFTCGSTGRKYVDQLSIEVSHLAVGSYPSEHLMAFSSVVLQHNRMVRKGSDV